MTVLRRQLPSLAAFLSWWRNELCAAVPEAWRRRVGPSFAGLVLDVGEAGAELARVEGGRRTVLAAPDGAVPPSLRGAAAVVRLPAGQALLRRLDLPRAAERDLDRIVAFEAERQTPFLPGEAVIDHRVVGRAAERLCIELAILPRARLAAAEALATRAGLAVAGVGLAADPAGAPLFDFLRDTRAPEAPLRRWLQWLPGPRRPCWRWPAGWPCGLIPRRGWRR